MTVQFNLHVIIFHSSVIISMLSWGGGNLWNRMRTSVEQNENISGTEWELLKEESSLRGKIHQAKTSFMLQEHQILNFMSGQLR